MPVTRGKSTLQRAHILDKQDRARQVIELAHQHIPSQQIADAFGISRRTVDRDIADTLALIQQQRIALGELVYDDHLALMDQAISALTAKAITIEGTLGDMDALKELRGWLDQRARLLGLYPQSNAPTAATQTIYNYQLNFGSMAAPAITPRDDENASDIIAGSAHSITSSASDSTRTQTRL